MANFLYNGVPLPALPEWDRTVYPFAFIVVGDITELIVSQYALKVVDIFGLAFSWYELDTGVGKNSSKILTYTLSDGQWGLAVTNATTPNREWNIVWANTDIPDTRDGTVYLAASEPIPVTAPQLEPLSLWMGWKAGNTIARQRGKVQKWETLFEGDVTSKEDVDTNPNEYLGAAHISMKYPGFSVGDTIRLTVNGESHIFTAIYEYTEESLEDYPSRQNIVYVGNSEVGGGVSNGFENENIIDYDYCLLQYSVYAGGTYLPANASAYLYTRAEGVYNVKIEKAV